MRDQVFWRKTARIICILADRLNISQERAMDLVYNSDTYALFTNPDSGLYLMSDAFIVEDLIREMQDKK